MTFPTDNMPDVEEQEIETPPLRRRPAVKETMFDEVARDLALWIDQTATEVALAFAPARSPFSAEITEEQKLEFYTARLFNPDGSPNHAGRQAEIARLGPEGFGHVYKAVIKAHPELKPPPPPEIEVPEQWPAAAPPGPPPGPPMMPPPMGPPPMPPGPPGPPMMPPMGGP